MKLKEVCARTGLTKRTVRFYEEKRLIAPQTQWRNGRNYRDYTEEDVELLREIAVLRKAMFTVEEIHAMQQEPERIAEILAEHGQRIEAMTRDILALGQMMKKLDPAAVDSVSGLAAQISGAVEDLPLPKTDRAPRFRYLDEMVDTYAEARRKKQEREKQRSEDMELAIHTSVSGAAYRKNPREIGPSNEQKLAILQMLRDDKD